MIHEKRKYVVVDVASAEELAKKLTEMTWCLCNGFRFDGLLFLNDAFSEDGAQEYAVIREKDMVQVESVTFSWINDQTKAQRIIERLVKDEQGEVLCRAAPTIQTSQEHGRCRHCA